MTSASAQPRASVPAGGTAKDSCCPAVQTGPPVQTLNAMNTLSGSPIEARPDDIHRDARREAAALESACSSGPAPVPFVTICVYSPSDTSALKRLAALDSSHVSAGPFLLAEIGGELRAALSLTDGAILADPFYPTAALVRLLVIRAQQVGGNRPAQKRQVAVGHHRPTWTLPQGQTTPTPELP